MGIKRAVSQYNQVADKHLPGESRSNKRRRKLHFQRVTFFAQAQFYSAIGINTPRKLTRDK